MTSLAIKDLKNRPGELSRALKAGQEVTVTYHEGPLGQVVPFEKWERICRLLDEHGLVA